MTRILFTARDRGAYGQLSAIAPVLAAAGHALCFVLSGDSPGVAGVTPDFPIVRLPDGPWRDLSDVPPATNARVRQLFEDFKPDIVVVGLADRVQIAVDELFLVTATGRVPTVMMQDFWGELKRVGHCEPDHYLVLDAVAAHNTATRASLHVIGSPKHAAYGLLDRHGVRSAFRETLGIRPDARVIGYFGQGLHREPSYRALVSEIADAVAGCGEADQLVYRPHPRESADDITASREILAKSGKLLSSSDTPPIEPWLLVVDVVLSCFSTCGYDMLHMNRLDPQPWASVVYVDHDPGISACWRRDSGLNALPPVVLGAALSSFETPLAQVLSDAFAPATRARLQAATIAAIPDPWDAPAKAAQTILALARKDALESASPSQPRPASSETPA